jgi:hypothetical protein
MMLTTVAMMAMVAMPDAGAPQEEVPVVAKLEGFFGFVEWVLDTSLTEAQRQEARQIAESTQDPDDRRLIFNGAEQEGEFGKQSTEDLTQLRPSVEDDYLRTMKSKYRNSAIGKWALKVDAAVKKKLSAGLTQQNVDAALELVSFVSGEVGQKSTPDAKALTVALAKMPADQKAALGQAAKTWWQLRLTWRQADEAKKAALRETWRPVLKPDAGSVGALLLKCR